MTARAESIDTPAQSVDVGDRQDKEEDKEVMKDLDEELLSTQHDLEQDSLLV